MAYRKSVKPVMRRTLANGMLAALSAIPGATLMNAPKVVLLKEMPDPTPDTLNTALIEANFQGYAAVAAGTLAGPMEETGENQAMNDSNTFIAADPLTTTNDIVGYAIMNTGKTDWYYCEKFEQPVGIVEPYDFLTLDTVLPVAMRPVL